jgi:hypothetical protein
MKPKRAGQIVAALAAACVAAGLGSAAALAATQQVAWGTTRSAPAGKLGELFGVAAVSPTEVLAVGGYNPGRAPTALLTNPYAERWNGTAWTATPVPLGPVYSPAQAAQLNGAAAVGPGDAWAVGTVSNPSSFASQTLAYHWDGTAWTRSPTPDPAGAARGNTLAAVAARTASDVWAVGGDGYSPAASLVLHWNGTAWRQVRVPNIGALDAVSTAPGRVWVAGGNRVEQYNGTSWSSLPPVTGLITGLADTPAGLWAVGLVEFGCGEGTCTANWAALWNGSAWRVVVSGDSTGLTGVTAAGQQALATSANTVLRLTANGASPQVTPYPGPSQLTAISAGPAGNPWAVGWTDNQGKISPAIINAPGIGQGGITVTTGASGATVTWAGPVTGAGSTDVGGRFATGGLPDGRYTVTASLPGCHPGIATAVVTAGTATPVLAPVRC